MDLNERNLMCSWGYCGFGTNDTCKPALKTKLYNRGGKKKSAY